MCQSEFHLARNLTRIDKDTFAVPIQETLETINIIRYLLAHLFDYKFELTEKYATSIFACLLSGAIQRDSPYCARKFFAPG